MSAMASQLIALIVYSTGCPGACQRKHQSSPSLAFVRRIHRWIPVTGQWRGKCFHLVKSSWCQKFLHILGRFHFRIIDKRVNVTSATLAIAGPNNYFQLRSRYQGQILWDLITCPCVIDIMGYVEDLASKYHAQSGLNHCINTTMLCRITPLYRRPDLPLWRHQ